MPRVTRKQPNSKMCLVCGLKNDGGLHASFYEVAGGELVALFTPREEHQSYPRPPARRPHHGHARRDHRAGRDHWRSPRTIWGVTVEFTTQFKKPVPLGVELKVVGRIVKQEGRVFEGTGEILLPGGEVAATGAGKYLRLPIGRIADVDAFAAGLARHRVTSRSGRDPAAVASHLWHNEPATDTRLSG